MDIELKIVDDGKGLTENEIKSMFAYETNIGLFTCKSLIEQMGGNITVQTKLGHGTSFSLNFKTVSKVIS